MKLILSVAVAWMLCSTAGALQCHVDRGTSACAAGEQCVAAALQGGRQVKTCVSPSICSPQNQTFSFNFGSVNLTADAYCCSTDNCNRQDVPNPAAQTPNPLRCTTCTDGPNPACNRTVQCVGVQDRCLRASLMVGNDIRKFSGCASRNVCLITSELRFLSDVLNFSESWCCNTNMCNAAGSFSLSAAPLLLGLFVFVGF